MLILKIRHDIINLASILQFCLVGILSIYVLFKKVRTN